MRGERESFNFEKGVRDIVMDIENTESYRERVGKILYMYNEYGKMLSELMGPESRQFLGEGKEEQLQ